jgi:hypothetical protein
MSYGRLRGADYTQESGEYKPASAPGAAEASRFISSGWPGLHPGSEFACLLRGDLVHRLVAEQEPEQCAVDQDQRDFNVEDRCVTICRMGLSPKMKWKPSNVGRAALVMAAKFSKGGNSTTTIKVDRH